MLPSVRICLLLAAVLLASAPAPAGAQAAPAQGPPAATPPALTPPSPAAATSPAVATGTPIPTDYVIGPDDVLGVLFWREPEISGDVTVRPDGMITIPLLRDIQAAGLRPDQLRERIQKASEQFISQPNVTVVIRQIRSRNAFITGQVARPGPYPIVGQMNVLQLIAIAGGLGEFADAKEITITRTEGGKTVVLPFNYKDVSRGKNVKQNIVLKPGDTVVVP
jgi:polysaccharide biosynthesis/export protein